jgi:ABC-2 type transport system permease protein
VNAVFVIGHTGVRLFLRNKAGYVWLFVVPFFFTYFMGFANKGSGKPGSPRPAVLIENHDQGFLGTNLVAELSFQGIEPVSKQQAGETQRGLRIPANLTSNALAMKPTKVEFFRIDQAGLDNSFLVELSLMRALVAINSHLLELASKPAGSNELTEKNLLRISHEPNPVSLSASFAGRTPLPSGFNQSLPGNLTMFLLMNLLTFGGASIAWERTNGVLRRLAVQPITRWELVMGKVYGRFLLGSVQIGVFLLLGQFLFKVNIIANLPGILLTLGLFAWLASSLGVMMGSIVQNPDKIIGLCVLVSMIMAALGGCWWPLEIVPDSMKMVGHLVPTAWAMDSLHRLISFGGNTRDILPELTILATFAVAANAGAAKFLKW